MPELEISPALKIHYLDPGPTGGCPVLLLHGLGATADSWQLQMPALQEAGFRPIAPDSRGFGQSSYPGGGLTIPALAADLIALLDHLQIEQAHAVGISMGGTLALQLALEHPERVQKLALVNTFAALRPDNANQFLYFLLRLVLVHTLGLPAQAKAVAARIFPRPEEDILRQELLNQILQADPRGYRAAMRALARFNVSDQLAEIRCPALVITGQNDTTVAPQRQKTLVECIPGARQVVIAGAGHAASVDSPGAFNRALIEFLL
jgi:pimeloyl-ACP methyl ester carboxylesterase